MILCFNLSNIAIITVKGVDYPIIRGISISDAIHLLKNSLLDLRGYIINAYQRKQYIK